MKAMTKDLYPNKVAGWFKTITNQRPEPWKEREATDALIEQLSDRVRELMDINAVLTASQMSNSVAFDQVCKHRDALQAENKQLREAMQSPCSDWAHSDKCKAALKAMEAK